MVSLTFYGGVSEIGGNKILLQDGDTKIFIDFGMSFGRRSKFFEEFLTPRTANGIGDFLAMGLIPDIKGIYREDLLKHIGRKPEEPEIDAVLLSHGHADHTNYISFLHSDIPIYCGETTLKLLKAIEEQSKRDIENEVINFKKRPLFRADYKKPPIERTFKTFRTGDKFKIGSLEIEPVHVDHCLAEDTFVQLANGEIAQVKDVPKSSFINVVDMKSKQINHALASKSIHNASQMLSIKTRFGELKSTGEHRFLCADGIDITEKRAKEMKPGDFLVYIKEIPFEGKKQELPKVNVRKIVNVSMEGLKIIKKKRTEKNLKQTQVAGLSKFYGDFERGRFGISLRNLSKILDFFDIDKKQFAKNYCQVTESIRMPEETSPEFFQLLGFALGDGSWYSESIKSPYLEISDKNRKNLELCQELSEKIFGHKGKIVTKHTNILQLSTYIGRLSNKISPHIFSATHTREIPSIVHKATKEEIAAFLRGLYDAEGSFRGHQVVLCSTSRNIVEVVKMLLLRFGILSSTYKFKEPISRRDAYHLNINHNESIKRFKKFIGFGSVTKQKKLEKFLSENKKSTIERIDLIPFNGECLKNALKEMEISTWDFQKGGFNIAHYTKGKHMMSRRKLKQLSKFLKKCIKGNRKAISRYVEKIDPLVSSDILFVPIKSIDVIDEDPVVYDFEVPGYSNFIANGFLVHNSVPGAYGFIIHTSSGAIAYTGDLRLHGNNPQMTRDFINKAKEAEPIAMICEGTRIKEKEDKTTEADVYARGKNLLSRSKSLSIIDFNFKDVDRFKTFFKIAKELDKKMVISFKHACYLDQYSTDSKLGVPHCCGDDNIQIFKPKVGTGTYDDGDYPDGYIKCRLHHPNVVKADELDKDCMIVLNFWYFNTLVDLKPEKGSIYMHSLSEPFDEEMEFSFERMMNWLDYFGMNFVQNHCSGHATGLDIKELIKEINPKVLFPIHTEFPGVFRKFGVNNKLVKYGKEYKIQ